MPLDASAVRCSAFEINKILTGGRIEKIYQPEKDEIVLLVKALSGNERLVISANGANPRIYITKQVKENPTEPPMFCMLMRKHITGGRITSVSSVDFERIIDITLEARNELGDLTEKHIICEIMGKNSNIILTDEKKKIIDSVKHVDITVSRVRNIFPGLTYNLPPDPDRQNPLEMNREDFLKVICDAGEGKSIEKALVGALSGVSPLQMREAAYSAMGKCSTVIGELTREEKERLAIALSDMFDKIKNNIYSPVILYKKGDRKPFDFAVYDVSQYENDAEKVQGESICGVLEEYYSARDSAERMRSRSYALLKNVTGQLEKIRKKVSLLHVTLKECEEKEKYKIAGDIITTNLYRINQGDKTVTAVNYYDEEQKEITITLDESKSPSKNAQQYYKKYQKAKTAEVEAAKQIEKAMSEMEYLESVVNEIELAKTPSELEEIRQELVDNSVIKSVQSKKKEKRKKMSDPEEYSFMGYTIYSGKNNVQNDYLTLKVGRANDLWLHTKNIPGSHVLVKYMGEEFPDRVIEVAATIAAVNSKGKNSPKVDVDYCPVSHVKKPNGTKAGMVIYEGYYTVTIVPDEELCDKIKV